MTYRVGIIGCGNIAPAYIKGCRDFSILEVTSCADVDFARAEAFATTHGLEAQTVEDLLGDATIDIVLNLTIPKAHLPVSLAIIEADKHVYSEKPLATNSRDAAKILDAAQAKGRRVGCAPDTFLGGGLQTCREIIETGVIGDAVGATAFMVIRGHEFWHPNPSFYYQVGGGPLFDMGPYYLTALVNLLGPMQGISAVTRRSFDERISKSGERIAVEVDTHVSGIVNFEQGAIATVIMSFDVWQHRLPLIEIYGSQGTLSVPDPNIFGGEVQVWLATEQRWKTMPHTHRVDVQRGVGVAEMAMALEAGREHRASGALAYHVLEAMEAFGESSKRGEHLALTSRVDRPIALGRSELLAST